MNFRTVGELAAGVKYLRRTAGLSQAKLAARVGVSRQWIVDLEAGKRGIELGLVLDTLKQLGVTLRAETPVIGMSGRIARNTFDDLDIPDAAEVLARATAAKSGP